MLSPEIIIPSRIERLHSKGFKAEINHQGALLEKLQDNNGRDLLFPNQVVGNKVRGGIPLCVPVFGAGAKFYGLNQHGYGRDLEWQYKKHQYPEGKLFVLENPNHQDDSIPRIYNDLVVDVIYSLQPASNNKILNGGQANPGEIILNSLMRLENLSEEEEIPVAPGYHPYFPVQEGQSADKIVFRFGSYRHDNQHQKSFSAQQLAKSQNISPDVKWVEFDIADKTMRVSQAAGGEGRFVIWSDQPDKYFCVEPTYLGTPNSKNKDNYHFRLAPKDIRNLDMQISFAPKKS